MGSKIELGLGWLRAVAQGYYYSYNNIIKYIYIYIYICIAIDIDIDTETCGQTL